MKIEAKYVGQVYFTNYKYRADRTITVELRKIELETSQLYENKQFILLLINKLNK